MRSRPVFLHEGKFYLDEDCRFGIYKPRRSDLETRMSSVDHSSCWDCEHFRVSGFPTRFCSFRYEPDGQGNLYPAIWSGDAENEFREMGYTTADQCPYFSVDPEVANLSFKEKGV